MARFLTLQTIFLAAVICGALSANAYRQYRHESDEDDFDERALKSQRAQEERQIERELNDEADPVPENEEEVEEEEEEIDIIERELEDLVKERSGIIKQLKKAVASCSKTAKEKLEDEEIFVKFLSYIFDHMEELKGKVSALEGKNYFVI